MKEVLENKEKNRTAAKQLAERYRYEFVDLKGAHLDLELFDSIIFTALERRASDIHIETRDTEVGVKYRIDGSLNEAMAPIAKEHHSTVISRIKVMSELDISERRVPQDGRFKTRYKGRSIDF